MLTIYDSIMAPMEKTFLQTIRQKCVPYAKGNVLEIGVGTGANFPFYNRRQISRFTALDTKFPSGLQRKEPKVKFVTGSVEKLPFADNSFDTVVGTLVLCSVPSLEQSIAEIYRVLKPGGRYIFMEHVLPHDPHLANAFNKVNPVWCKVANGCNINRNTCQIIGKKFTKTKTGSVGKGVFCYGIAEK